MVCTYVPCEVGIVHPIGILYLIEMRACVLLVIIWYAGKKNPSGKRRYETGRSHLQPSRSDNFHDNVLCQLCRK
jgi:hypothetical protein